MQRVLLSFNGRCVEGAEGGSCCCQRHSGHRWEGPSSKWPRFRPLGRLGVAVAEQEPERIFVLPIPSSRAALQASHSSSGAPCRKGRLTCAVPRPTHQRRGGKKWRAKNKRGHAAQTGPGWSSPGGRSASCSYLALRGFLPGLCSRLPCWPGIRRAVYHTARASAAVALRAASPGVRNLLCCWPHGRARPRGRYPAAASPFAAQAFSAPWGAGARGAGSGCARPRPKLLPATGPGAAAVAFPSAGAFSGGSRVAGCWLRQPWLASVARRRACFGGKPKKRNSTHRAFALCCAGLPCLAPRAQRSQSPPPLRF